MTPQIIYIKSENVWANFIHYVMEVIDRYHVKSICEVGGGANPLLGVDILKERNLKYTVLDISEEELQKAPDMYNKGSSGHLLLGVSGFRRP